MILVMILMNTRRWVLVTWFWLFFFDSSSIFRVCLFLDVFSFLCSDRKNSAPDSTNTNTTVNPFVSATISLPLCQRRVLLFNHYSSLSTTALMELPGNFSRAHETPTTTKQKQRARQKPNNEDASSEQAQTHATLAKD